MPGRSRIPSAAAPERVGRLMLRSRLRGAARLALQVGALASFALAGGLIARALRLPIPGAVVGMALLLLCFRLRVLPLGWFDAGASALFRHMLLFFVPTAVGVVQYPQLFGSAGVRALAVIAASTLLVMVATGLAVEWAVVRRRSRP